MTGMKICIIGSVYPRHPADTEVPWLRETVNRCRAAGLDICVFAPSFRGIGTHVVDGVTVHRFRYFFSRWETLTHEEGAPNKIHKLHYKFITLSYLLFGTLGLIRLHVTRRFDILHVHWPAPHALFALAAILFRRAKLVLTFHGAELLLVNKYPFVRPLLRFFIGRADGVTANSRFTAGRIRSIRDCDVRVIPYGTTLGTRTPAAKPAGSPPAILSAGRMIERKGFEYLVRAMPLVRKSLPDAVLTMVGGGPLENGLRQLASDLHLEKAVRFTGKISPGELERLFVECDAFALPAVVDRRGDTEGLGVVLIEAFSYGKPAVASDVGGIPDLVINEKTGLLVPQKDPQALAGALIRILSDRELANRLGQAAFEHVRKSYCWETIVARLMEVYGG